MYVPKEFSASSEQQVDQFIAEHPFITLITTGEEGYPIATHLPIIATKEGNNWGIEGHISLANAQHQAILQSKKALCTILGADSYISSSVYAKENVPTWNYESVHLYGELKPLSEEELDTHLSQLVQFFEKNREKPLEYGQFSPKMIQSYKKEILGFRMKVDKTEAAFKLSQNRSKEDQEAIISDLKKCPFSGAQRIAQNMKQDN